MDDKNLLYIEDAHNRKLFYRFTPAAIISNFVPLLVILHDEGGEFAPNFEYKMWNVLTPLDNYGYENRGSSWLGENGDFFLKDLLQTLIQQIAEEHECEDHIYLYGGGIGGYGAILHGILAKANTVFVNTPRIRLLDTAKKEVYTSIFAQTVSKETDLTNFLNPTDSFPLFYLCGNANSSEDEIEYFVNACKKHAIKVYLDFCPESEYDEIKSLKKVLDMLERMTPAD